MKLYFRGCSGIKKPVDVDGDEICEGDILTWDLADSKIIKDWMYEPTFKVEKHKSGNGFCAKGIHNELYLHDFRFKFCKLIK